ncbi:MAG: hypothetical protein ABFS32_17235 [Bacteroidota bacterium]
MPNKLSQFWRELKRRNVTRVLAVYIAAGFMILELISMTSEPFGLPEGTLKVAFIISLAGLVIAAILSWTFDIHPEGGIVKTEPDDKVKSDEIPTNSSNWKIASYISFVVIVGLIVLNIIPRTKGVKGTEELDRSIAVLPFISLSDDPEKQYLADGVMDAILLHLSKIEDLRVMSRTSVEQYRVTDKKVTEICQELDVGFVLEGSFRKYGDQARLIVQLIQSGKEDHAWAKQYDREWEDIFTVESEVAQSVAQELKAVITPEEKQLMEKKPTTNPLAYDFYQRGRDQFLKFRMEGFNSEAFEKSEGFFRKAIELDSTFAQAYTGLAWTYYYTSVFKDIFSENFLDSLITLADAALNFDNQLSEAHTIKGIYYSNRAQPEKAIAEFDMALDLNPNDWMAYESRGELFLLRDLLRSLDNYHKAINLNHGEELLRPLTIIQLIYGCFLGMEERGTYYARQILELNEDSASYYETLATQEQSIGNFERSNEYCKKAIERDSNRSVDFILGYNAFMLRNFESAYTYLSPMVEAIEESGDSASLMLFLSVHGYLLFERGYPDQAKKYFEKQIRNYSNIVELGGRSFVFDPHEAHFELAAVYAFIGEKEKAYEHLREANQRKWMGINHVAILKYSPFFDSIRDEPEFLQIVRDIEAKYKASHERVRQWLEDNEML